MRNFPLILTVSIFQVFYLSLFSEVYLLKWIDIPVVFIALSLSSINSKNSLLLSLTIGVVTGFYTYLPLLFFPLVYTTLWFMVWILYRTLFSGFTYPSLFILSSVTIFLEKFITVVFSKILLFFNLISIEIKFNDKFNEDLLLTILITPLLIVATHYILTKVFKGMNFAFIKNS